MHAVVNGCDRSGREHFEAWTTDTLGHGWGRSGC